MDFKQNKVRRLTLKTIKQDVLEILNLEKGLFFTLVRLFKDPKETVETYLFKDRSKLFNPFRFVFFAVAIYSFFILKIFDGLDFSKFIEFQDNPEYNEVMKNYTEKIFNLYNISTLLSIPCLAFFSFLLFGREKYNYAEHLAINSYVFGIASWIAALSLAIGYFTNPFLSILLGSVFYILAPLYWYKRIYQKSWVSTTTLYLLVYFVGTAISGVLTLIFAYQEFLDVLSIQ